MAPDGVARGGTGSVVVSRCVCLCVGRVAKCSECREKRRSGIENILVQRIK